MTTPANWCEHNELYGIGERAQSAESGQASDSPEVIPNTFDGNAEKTAVELTGIFDNSKPGNHIQDDVRIKAYSISHNTLALNDLRGCDGDGNGKNHDQKSKSRYTPSGLARWLRFNLVGGIGMMVQFVVLFLLKSEMHIHYLAATAIAVEAAIVHNFVWHVRFTWADINRTHHLPGSSLKRFLRFNLSTGAISIFGNLALMKVMVDGWRMNYLLANAIAIATCALANFLVSEKWVFVKE